MNCTFLQPFLENAFVLDFFFLQHNNVQFICSFFISTGRLNGYHNPELTQEFNPESGLRPLKVKRPPWGWLISRDFWVIIAILTTNKIKTI